MRSFDTRARFGKAILSKRVIDAASGFTFKTTSAKALLYRTPDGKIQQFLLYKA